MFIKEWRKKRGLTQEKLAELVGIHPNTLLKWEYGTREPKASELQKLAKALGITEADLLNGPASQELEVKIVMGVKSVSALAGISLASNSFTYGVNDTEPSIVLMGNVRIETPEDRTKAREEILRKFDAACWMYDHRDEAGN